MLPSSTRSALCLRRIGRLPDGRLVGLREERRAQNCADNRRQQPVDEMTVLRLLLMARGRCERGRASREPD
jgi:hypothetical protein